MNTGKNEILQDQTESQKLKLNNIPNMGKN